MSQIKENLDKLELGKAKLIAVTKQVPVERILEGISWGITDIGENYIQDAEEKYKRINNKVKWHFIGHLQKNKVNQAVKIFDVIQSVDSYKLAKRINKAAKENEKIVKVMIQVNITGDKHGVEPENVISLYRALTGLKHLEVIGLMCIADRDNPRVSFKKMRNLNSKLNLPYMSMGMSNDYKIALEEGSNMVRLGEAVFGRRSSNMFEDALGDIVDFFKETWDKIKEI